jgi:hypothetical protein
MLRPRSRRRAGLEWPSTAKPARHGLHVLCAYWSTECLNAHWFMSLDDAPWKCEAWRRDHNEERPRSAIGNKAPIELIDRSVALDPP